MDDNPDIQAGINIVLKALEAPVRQIVENAGVEGSVVVGKINENKSEAYGFDAQTEQYVDMLSAGIIDPASSMVGDSESSSRRRAPAATGERRDPLLPSQAETMSPGNCVRPLVHAELDEDILDMRFHSFRGYPKLARDILI
jgi:chaperonin GroEL